MPPHPSGAIEIRWEIREAYCRRDHDLFGRHGHQVASSFKPPLNIDYTTAISKPNLSLLEAPHGWSETFEQLGQPAPVRSGPALPPCGDCERFLALV